MLSFPELHFNMDNSCLKVLVCGFKTEVLWQGDYVTLVQCECHCKSWLEKLSKTQFGVLESSILYCSAEHTRESFHKGERPHYLPAAALYLAYSCIFTAFP
uniref:Uncharacterized protein n=1 Tax=Amazona collaria TaxID=241587 RepID=A0A8B9GEL3_9PSIT